MDMAPTRFVGSEYKNPRSARIHDATWDRHKKLLCTLYRSYRLADVMTFMELRHGFKPSKRQYGYRFEKWGVKKYNSGDKRTSMRPIAEMESFVNSRMGRTLEFLDIPDARSDFPPSPASSYAASEIEASIFEDDSEAEGKLSLQQTPAHSILYAWTAGEAKTKLVADFCFVMNDDTNAFDLYRDLYDRARKKSEANTTAKNMLVISCARAAEHAADVKTASELLVRHPSRFDGEAGKFLFPILDAFLKERDGEADKTDAKSAIWDIMHEFLGQNSHPELPRRCGVLDVVAYQCLHQGLGIYEAAQSTRERSPSFSSEHFLNKYVQEQLLPGILSRCYILRSCVDWCASQLRHRPPVPPMIHAIESHPSQRPWCDNIYVFCALWDSMRREIANKANQPSWYSEAEPALGICPSELLITICWMIGDEARSKDINFNGNVVLRAAIGAAAMSEWHEGDLWIKFLRKFTWMNQVVDPQPDDKAFGDVVLSHVREYITSALHVRLPVSAQDVRSTSTNFSDRIQTFTPITGNGIFDSFNGLAETSLFQPGITVTQAMC